MQLEGLVITDPQAAAFPASVRCEHGRIRSVEPVPDRPGLPHVSAGLIDAHTHPLELGLQQMFCDLGSTGSVNDVLALVRSRLADCREFGLLLGFNLEPERLKENRFPTREELDHVSADLPMLLYRVDGHSAVLNTAGLMLAFGQDNGQDADGVVRGPSYEQASRELKRRLKPDTIRQAMKQAASLCLASGVTTFAALIGNEAMTEPECRVLLDSLSGLPCRAVPFLQNRSPALCKRLGLTRVGGCLLIDGSFGSHTAALETDYTDQPGNCGICYYTDDQLGSLVSEAERLGLSTAFHAIGDRAVEQLVRCRERLGTRPELRHRIEHAELLNPRLIDRIAERELILCVQPAFEAFWGGPDRMYARRLGDRWKSTNPYRSLLSAGVVLAGGSDAPITPVDPLAGIRAAANHPNPDQRIWGNDAFAMFTTTAAYSLGLEMLIGRVAPGFAADLTVLSADPRSDSSARILAAYVSGELCWKA